MSYRGLMSFLSYLVAGYFFDRRKLVESRKWMDRSLAKDTDPHRFILANDAILLILEERTDEAWQRFRECLQTLPANMSANDYYLEIFCNFWLAALSKQLSSDALEEMKLKASNSKADRWLQRRLLLPSLDSIRDTLDATGSGRQDRIYASLAQAKASSIRVKLDL